MSTARTADAASLPAAAPAPVVVAAPVTQPGELTSEVATPVPSDAPAPPPGRVASAWIILIALLLLLHSLTQASAVVVPFVLAVLISLTLAPVMRLLTRLYLPRALAAILLVVGGLTLTWGIGSLLAEPAQAWMERAPEALRRLEQKVHAMREPLEAANEATERLMNLAQETTGKPAATTVVAEAPSPLMGVLEGAPALLASILATVFLVFLFLLYGDAIFRKFVALVPGLSAKKEFVSGTREAQVELSRYLVTVTAINLALGVATAAALWALGVPDPILWGGLAALLNYAPYLGAVVTVAILFVVGFAEFADPWKALAVPGSFAVLNILEGQLVTPMLVGRRLALDPVVIFLTLMLFGWMWGFAGMLMAVPLLSCLKVFAQRVPGGEKYAQLLSE